MWELAECWRIDAFELRCWRSLLRVLWTTRRSKQSILKEISPEYSLEGLMLKLKLQYIGHLMWKADSLEKTLMLGKIEGRRRRGWQRRRWLNSITDSMDYEFEQAPGEGKGQGSLAWCSPQGHKESDMTEQLNSKWDVRMWKYLKSKTLAAPASFLFFLAVLGLHCYMQAFSNCGAQPSRCGGFSSCRAWVLRPTVQ